MWGERISEKSKRRVVEKKESEKEKGKEEGKNQV